MIIKYKNILFSGAGLLEALLAIGLLSSMAPFVLKSVNKQTATTRNIALSKEIENVIYATSNYMDAHMPVHSVQANSVPEKPVPHSTSGQQIMSLLSDYGLNENLVAIFSLFDEVRLIMDKKEDSVDGYFVLSGGSLEPLQLQEVAAMIGPNAGVIDEGTVYGMAHNWNLNTDDILGNRVSTGLIIQISRGAGRVDIYLNRVVPEKAIMYTDIFMGESGNGGKCKTDNSLDVEIVPGKLIDYKIVNTGVVETQSVLQSFDYKGSYQELDGLIDGKAIHQFKVSDVTEVGDLKIANFVIPDPATFDEPDNGNLTMKANKKMTSLIDATTKLSDPSKDSYIGLTFNYVSAQNSSLKAYNEKSFIRNIRIQNLSASKIRTNVFTSKATQFNSNIILRAKEIRVPSVGWGSTINAGAIIAGKITYKDEDGADKLLIGNDGMMYVPDFFVLSYDQDDVLEVGSKQLSNIIRKIKEEIIDVCTRWNTIHAETYNGTKSECTEILNINS